MTATHEIGERNGEPFIKCLRCGTVSFNLHDIVARYCAGCHEWHEAESLLGAAEAAAERMRRGHL